MTDRDWVEVGVILMSLEVEYTFEEQKRLMEELDESEVADEEIVIEKFRRLFSEKFNCSYET